MEQVDGRLRRSGLVDLLARLECRMSNNFEIVRLTAVRRSREDGELEGHVRRRRRRPLLVLWKRVTHTGRYQKDVVCSC